MKKMTQQMLILLCNVLGTIGALYVGGWIMFLRPIQLLYSSFMSGTLNVQLVLLCGIRILLSTTFAGLVWCLGYIASNYIKGNEDPDWNVLNAKPETKEQGEWN